MAFGATYDDKVGEKELEFTAIITVHACTLLKIPYLSTSIDTSSGFSPTALMSAVYPRFPLRLTSTCGWCSSSRTRDTLPPEVKEWVYTL